MIEQNLFDLTQAFFHPHSVTSEKGLADNKATADKRHAEGRYTLEEAAFVIGSSSGERVEEILAKLVTAAGTGQLAAYEPGRKQRYGGTIVRTWYEECYWDDLNGWLSVEEPRLQYRFPSPVGRTSGSGAQPNDLGQLSNSTAKGEVARAAEQAQAATAFPPAPSSISGADSEPKPYELATREELIDAFGIPPENEYIFNQVHNIRGLLNARERVGNGRKLKAGFNPVLFIEWYLSSQPNKSHRLSPKRAVAVLKERFPNAFGYYESFIEGLLRQSPTP